MKALLILLLVTFSGLFVTNAQVDLHELTDYKLLVKNCVMETSITPMDEKVAVIIVVLNRVDSAKYPNTIKGVVLQRKQFSWTNNYTDTLITYAQVQECEKAVSRAYRSKRHPYLHYYASRGPNGIQTPKWAFHAVKSADFKYHTFVKLKGGI